MHPLRIVIFGRQGSGKGTQCSHLVRELGVVHLSTGDILRSNIEQETELGLKVKPILAQGGLVDDQTMLELVDKRIKEVDVQDNGFILDGFPRTLNQAKGLLEFLGADGLDSTINLEVSMDEVMRRILERGREDDIAESIKERLRLYEVETVPTIQMFDDLGMLKTVDGIGLEAEVTQRILQELKSLIK